MGSGRRACAKVDVRTGSERRALDARGACKQQEAHTSCSLHPLLDMRAALKRMLFACATPPNKCRAKLTCMASAPLARTPALGPAPADPPRAAREWSSSRYTSGVTCMRAHVRAWVCVCVCARVCMHACMCVSTSAQVFTSGVTCA